jgi:regulator of protease activity HflC (stomatin/prohibitin superfamily)
MEQYSINNTRFKYMKKGEAVKNKENKLLTKVKTFFSNWWGASGKKQAAALVEKAKQEAIEKAKEAAKKAKKRVVEYKKK